MVEKENTYLSLGLQFFCRGFSKSGRFDEPEKRRIVMWSLGLKKELSRECIHITTNKHSKI